MKKQLLPGVALGLCLVLCTAVCANPVRETPEQAELRKATTPADPLSISQATPEESKPVGLSSDRSGADSSTGVAARWRQIDQTSGAEIMAFTSTFSAQQAASLMNRSDGALSFSAFGRVPYYQVLTTQHPATTTSLTQPTSRAVASLPEPASLLLLGTGLAALAAGLRKRNKQVDK